MLKLKDLFIKKNKAETFFLKKIFFESSDPRWSENYLADVNLRLTSLLKDTLKNNFWEKYSEVLIRYHLTGKLLLRTKHIENGGVYLTQVWRTPKDFEDFIDEALQGHSIKKYLERMSLKVTETSRLISILEVKSFLRKLEALPCIIQFIIPDWLNKDMVVGDPLKKGKLYLPFQEEV